MLITIISAEHSLRSKWVREYFASKGDEVEYEFCTFFLCEDSFFEAIKKELGCIKSESYIL